MFSPIKAITAGVLVFALGGLFLIAQPFDQGGSVPGAEQGAEPLVPVRITSETSGVTCGDDPIPEVDGPVERWYGTPCEVHKEWGDPRLEGTVSRELGPHRAPGSPARRREGSGAWAGPQPPSIGGLGERRAAKDP